MSGTARRFAWVDALRGVASLEVTLFHGQLRLWAGVGVLLAGSAAPSLFDRISLALSLPGHFGYAGVMLFFLLSGFCIHHPNARAERLDLGDFAIRRFIRIYPPYVAALDASLIVSR